MKTTIALLISFLAWTANASSDRHKIIPGQCIDNICLGDSSFEVVKSKGTPLNVITITPLYIAKIWKIGKCHDNFIIVIFDRNENVSEVHITSSEVVIVNSNGENLTTEIFFNRYFENAVQLEYTIFSNGQNKVDFIYAHLGLVLTKSGDMSGDFVRTAVLRPGKEKAVGNSEDDWYWFPKKGAE